MVINENMLCYVNQLNRFTANILQPSFIKGASCGWPLCPEYPIDYNWKNVRFATKKDFKEYNCTYEPYENDKITPYIKIDDPKIVILVHGSNPIVLEPEDRVEINKYLDVYKTAKELKVDDYFLFNQAWYLIREIKN